MKRFAALLATLTALLLCGLPPTAEAQKKMDKVTLRLNWFAYGEHAPFAYGLKKGLRGRFGNYVPPVLEVLGLAEVEHNPRNNRTRAI